VSILEKVQTGVKINPPRIAIHGIDGIGKSTFGAAAPRPIFLCSERGADHLGAARISIASWPDLIAACSALYHDPHEYATVVLDSVDWFEGQLQAHVTAEAGVDSIEKVGGGYGKGHIAMAEKFRELIGWLDALNTKRRMCVIVIAHSVVKTYDDPTIGSYDRFTMKLDKRIGPMLAEWADYLFFYSYDVSLKTEGQGFKEKSRGVSYGHRYMHTQRTPAYDAKRRWNIPDRVLIEPASPWGSFWSEHNTALKQSAS